MAKGIDKMKWLRTLIMIQGTTFKCFTNQEAQDRLKGLTAYELARSLKKTIEEDLKKGRGYVTTLEGGHSMILLKEQVKDAVFIVTEEEVNDEPVANE
jgi:hypothetical protein